MHMSSLPVWMYVYHVRQVWYPWRSEDSISPTGTGVRDNCEPSCVCWELDWTEPGLSERTACALNCGESSPRSLISYWNCEAIIKEWGLEDHGRVKETAWLSIDVHSYWPYRQTLRSKWADEAHTWFLILKFEFTNSFTKKGLERWFSG